MIEPGADTTVVEVYANIVGVVYGAMKLDDGQMQELERMGDGAQGVLWALKNARKGGGADVAPELVDSAEPEMKTRIADCRACWCDDCGRIEACARHLYGATPDGIATAPCVGCKDGMRFRPKELKADCEYTPGDGLNHG